MTWKTVSCKIDEEDFNTIQNCIESGSCENTSEFVRSAIEHEIENCVWTIESEDKPKPTLTRIEEPKPTLTKMIQGEVIEPIKLTCKNGELWTHWNSDRIRTKYGNTSDFGLNDGKVYKNGSLVGIIENQD